MILTPQLLLRNGFKAHSNSFYYLNSFDHLTVAFYSWDKMIVQAGGEYLKDENIVVDQIQEFYKKVTGRELVIK